MFATPLFLSLMHLTPPAPLAADTVARLLEAHVCVMGEHAPVTAQGFVEGLRVHLWALPGGAHHAITYVEQHRLPGFTDTLLKDVHTRDQTAQSHVAGALLRIPDPPAPATLWTEAKKVEDRTLRARFLRALERTGEPAQVLPVLRDARAAEKEPTVRRTIELVAAKLGDDDARASLAAALPGLALDDVLVVLHDLQELAPAPRLAPLLLPLLDDKRAVGTMSHRQSRSYLVRDHAVWMVQQLGVPLDPPLASITFADDALVRRTKQALKAHSARPTR